MAIQEVLIYGGIDECTSAEFIENINEELEEDANAEIVVRINTGGGSPEYGWGMVAKFSELANKRVKVDGKAYSMGLFFCCYTDNVEALDVSQFILHRAAYPDWMECDDNFFTEPMKANLANINKSLRLAFESKVDVVKFENLKSVKDKGITLDSIFSMDSRIDVPLTAKEAKQIGLIKNIVTITPQIKAEIESKLNNKMAIITASYIDKKQIITTTPKTNKMTVDQLKTENPEVFAQVVAMGVANEKSRVKAFMAFHEHDSEGVNKAIADGTEFTAAHIAEFSAKALSNFKLKGMITEAATASTTVATEATAKSESELALEAFKADYKKGI